MKECWCPCGCGCNEDNCGPFTSEGLCADCGEDNHEIPPEDIKPTLEQLRIQHLRVAKHYYRVINERNGLAMCVVCHDRGIYPLCKACDGYGWVKG